VLHGMQADASDPTLAKIKGANEKIDEVNAL
jgi:hypothetical protein